MTQQKRNNRNNIVTTSIPLAMQINSTLGIINFTSQNYNTLFEKPQIKVVAHNEEITFKSAVGKQSNSQDSDDDFIRKKIIPIHKITIKPSNIKKKYFKVDIPINKAGLGVRNNREKMHFLIEFDNDKKGTLTIVDEVYDSQMEVTNSNSSKQLSLEEKIKMQDSKLDARKRQEKIQILEEKKDLRKKEK